jgi:hypothetical protein
MIRRAVVILILIAGLATLAQACPMCKDAVESATESGASLQAGFNGSIYLLLGGFAAGAGMIGVALKRAIGKSVR